MSQPMPRPGVVPVAKVLARSLLTIAVLTAAYFVAPLDRVSGIADGLTLVIGLGILAVVVGFQVTSVLRSRTPGARAVQSLSVTIPFFLYLFAATYYVLATSHPTNFSETGLTRLDTLYFTVTVFATVGFGDITATSQHTRMLVTVQMILDLLVIGAVIRVFFQAVESARKRHQEAPTVPEG